MTLNDIKLEDICLRVYGKEKAKELEAKGIITYPIADDLVAVPYGFADVEMGNGTMVFNLPAEILKLSGFTKENIWETGCKNLAEADFLVTDLMDLTQGIVVGATRTESLFKPFEDKLLQGSEPRTIVIMTRAKKANYSCLGAAWIANKELLAKVGNAFGEDYYILPMSVHEVLVIPCSEEENASVFKEMVMSINDDAEIIHDEDFLSNHIFRYHTSNGFLETI